MTQPEMIEQFKKQLEEVVTKIKELDQELNLKKEEYFKLTGAVQALELAAKEGGETSTEVNATPITPSVPPQATSKGCLLYTSPSPRDS